MKIAGIAFVLDIADLFRDEVTLPIAFSAVRAYERDPGIPLERLVRRSAGRDFRQKKLISKMIYRVKELFDANVRGSDP